MEEEVTCTFVSTRGIAKFCDSNPYWNLTPNYIIPLNNKKCSTIYLHFDSVELFIKEYLDKIINPFILVTGNSDHISPYDFPSYQKLLNSDKMIVWFSQNVVMKHPKLKHLPIGLDYHTLSSSQGAHEWTSLTTPLTPLTQENRLKEIKNRLKPLEETRPIAVTNFHHSMGPPQKRTDIRTRIYDTLKDKKGINWLEKQTQEEFWETLNDNAFVICPFGNGLDTHRTWEALCLGRIPIVEKSNLNEVYEGLPISVIDDWNDFSEDWLQTEYTRILDGIKSGKYNYDKILLSTWMNIINSYKNTDTAKKIKGCCCIGLITKNVSMWILQVFKVIEMYASCFEDYKVLFVDASTKDATFSLCRDWVEKDNLRRNIIQQPSTFNKHRLEAISEARNMVLDHFRPYFGEDVYLLLLDSDSINSQLINMDGFLKSFETTFDWAGLFPNQKVLYDTYALRDDILKENYQWKHKNLHFNDTTMQNALKKYQTQKHHPSGFYPVDSYFGGAGLYKTKYLKFPDIKYKCREMWKDEYGNLTLIYSCEHVIFHSLIRKHGGKFFINCDWINGVHI